MKAYKFLPLLVAMALAGCGEKPAATSEASVPAAAPAASAPAPVTSSAPVAVATAPAAAAPSAPAASAEELATGEKVYTASCVACHGAGVMGAPKSGDKAAWEPRIAQGMDTLHANAINGIRMMPPRGGNAALKDDEVKAAVSYMISKT